MAAETPDGGGGVRFEMEPKPDSFPGKPIGGEGMVKAETELMGLAEYAGVNRTKGLIKDLFVENVGKYGGSDELVPFTKQVIDVVGNHTERLTLLGELGRGKCGKVDEVQLVDFPGGSYALKTISEVNRARCMNCMNTLAFAGSREIFACYHQQACGVHCPSLTHVIVVCDEETRSRFYVSVNSAYFIKPHHAASILLG